jgi:hypothetical protein
VKPPSFRCFAARPIEETLAFGRSTERPKGCRWADRGVRRASRTFAAFVPLAIPTSEDDARWTQRNYAWWPVTPQGCP